MNLEKLEVGMVVKNYKAMCELLEVSNKTGNSKKAQLKDWERYFEYDKDGTKFVIKTIYDSSKPKDNNHGGSRYNVYGDVIQLLILNLLGKENGQMTIGRTKLQNAIGMTNFNFNTGKSKMEDLAKILETNIYTVQDFYNTNEDNLKNAINSSLSALKDKRIISYEITLKCRDRNSGSYRNLSDEEKEIILLIEGRILRQMGYDSISDVRCSGEWKEYREKCLYLVRELTSIDYYFEAYKIFINKEFAEEERLKLLESIIISDDDFKNKKQTLNSIIIERNNLNATKRHSKELTIKNTYKKHRLSKEYEEDIRKLGNLLLDINCNKDLRILLSESKVDDSSDIDSILEQLPF